MARSETRDSFTSANNAPKNLAQPLDTSPQPVKNLACSALTAEWGSTPAKGRAMPGKAEEHLSRRERQIMDVVYARGEASAAEVHVALPDAPSRTAVRTLLGILEE